MFQIERWMLGLLRYRKVYFPQRDEAIDISRSLTRNEILRFFGVFCDLGKLQHLVKREQSLTTWIDLSAGLEAVLRGMKKKSCRYEIRHAEKMIDRVVIETNSQRAMKDFLAVYNDFAKTKVLVPRLTVRKLLEYSAHGEVLVIYLDGRALCAHLLLCDAQAGIARLLYSGTRRLESSEDAAACGALNRYLHWHEMQRYHAKGFAIYDFGGIRFPEHPTARFKLSFGGRVVTEHYYLLSRSRWITMTGNLVLQKLFRHRTIPSRIDAPEIPTSAIESHDAQEKVARC